MRKLICYLGVLSFCALLICALWFTVRDPQEVLPDQFASLSPVSQEYLLSAVNEQNWHGYKLAMDNVNSDEMRSQIGYFGTAKLFRAGQAARSTSLSFELLAMAVEIAPDQMTKDSIITRCQGMVDFYGGDDFLYYQELAAGFLETCVQYSSASRYFQNKLVSLYTNIAENCREHDDKAHYMFLARNVL